MGRACHDTPPRNESAEIKRLVTLRPSLSPMSRKQNR